MFKYIASYVLKCVLRIIGIAKSNYDYVKLVLYIWSCPMASFVFAFKLKSTVFPHIIAAATILFWNLRCGNYSREETIQRRKLFL